MKDTTRQPIAFDNNVLDRLKNYIKKKYGGRRALSIVVNYAVIKLLDEEENGSKTKRKARK